MVLVLAPLLGGVADRKGYKKRFLLLMTVIGAAATMLPFFLIGGLLLPRVRRHAAQ